MDNSFDKINSIYANYEQYGKDLNAFITLRPKDIVLAEHAKLVDSDLPLAGIPYVLKDAYVTRDILTTSASHVLSDFIPPYSATVYNKMQTAGAVLIGKMNMDSWGHGGSTENTDYGACQNPWDPSRVAGGSSGGPATAIAADLAECAIGEDTGGVSAIPLPGPIPQGSR
jgi:aspartyl-tRNA(Asn)/glutamyl-tRNA(Gln) amidotransferase subunit A